MGPDRSQGIAKLKEWTNKYDGIFPVWFSFSNSFLFLSHPDYIKAIVSTSGKFK